MPTTYSKLEHEQGLESEFDVAVLLWVRMTEIYGHFWPSNFGKKANKSWRDMLATLSVDEIKHGVQLCKREVNMPNLPKFYELCKAMPDPQRFAPALPKPAVDKAKIRAEIEKSNALLDGGVVALREKQAKEKRVQELIWKQLHDPEYIAQMQARRDKMMAEWQAKLAEQEALLNQA